MLIRESKKIISSSLLLFRIILKESEKKE